jgi:hypothetical protein
MATQLRMQEERSLILSKHAGMFDKDVHRSAIENRQFSYSDHLTEKNVEIEFKILPARKFDKNFET